MRIIFSIFMNALILLLVAYLLGANPSLWLTAWVHLACSCSYFSLEAWKTYLIGGILLGLMNYTIRPVLKILTLPFFFLFFGLTFLIVNAVILKLLSFILNDILQIPWVGYSIEGWVNFVIAVAIFSLLNMVYGLLLSKK
jgi:putative membrane protein